MVRVSIAGLTVALTCDAETLTGRLRERYRLFRTDQPADIHASVRVAGSRRTSALLDTGTTFRDGVLYFTAPGYDGTIDVEAGRADLTISSQYPAEEVEYFLRVIYALLAFQRGGLLFHAAGIVRNGRGYLFFGHSGSGKTTVARLSADDVVLNDDLVLLMPAEDGWRAYATPFWNPSQVQPTRQNAPLAAMFRLIQSKEVSVETLRPSQAVAEIISNVPIIPDDPQRTPGLLVRSRELLRTVPAYRLYFLPDDSFWHAVASVA